MEERTELKLLALACAGDKEAFGTLISRYQGMAQGIALRFSGNPEIASELVQEAMVQAYLSLERLQNPARFKSWFYGIVLNVCRNYLRGQKLAVHSLDAMIQEACDTEYALPALDADPQEVIEERELYHLMMQAVQRLSAKNRAVTTLFYYAQLNLREVADTLGISVVAVKSRLQQARKELREQLLLIYPEMGQTLQRERKRSTMTAMIHVTIADIIQQEPYSAVILLDENGKRALPVWIGYWEGQAITASLRNIPTTGPLTFNLMTNLLQATSCELEEVRIDALKEDTLYATLRIRHGNVVQDIDARPGDALALATYTNSAVSVAEDLLKTLGTEVTNEHGKLSQQELDAVARHLKEKQPRPYSSLTKSSQGHKRPRNLDGSDGKEGWMIAGSHAQNYEFGFDQHVQYGDAASLYLRAKISDTGGYATLVQILDADEYKGKQVAFSCQVKTKGVMRARPCIYVYGPNAVSVLTQSFGGYQAITGTNDWQPVKITLAIPGEAVRLVFGTILSGDGQVWLNEITFSAVASAEQPDTDETTDTVYYTSATEPRNLDFSQGLKGWHYRDNGSAQNYTYGIDQQIKLSDTGSLYLKGDGPEAEGQVGVRQSLKTDNYKGKRVRISGMIRAVDVAAWASLWVTMNGKHGGIIMNSNMQQKQEHNLHVRGTHDWQHYEVVVDVPEESSRVTFGIGLMGQGQIWLDKVQFEVVGDDVPTTV